MKKLMLLLLLAAAVLAGGALWTESTLAPLEDAANRRWTAADGAIRRRAALAGPIAAFVTAYTSKEQKAVRETLAAQKALEEAKGPAARMKASDELSSALGRLLNGADRYRAITAHPAYRELMTGLMAAENAIAVTRRDYNDAAQQYNGARSAFPASLYASWLGFEEAPYFRPGQRTL